MDEQNFTPHSHFSWDKENATMRFAGEPAVLFWVETAMKSFLDTIEEVSGTQGAKIVMETAGYRMGLIVSKFFDFENAESVIREIPVIYASAGWGKIHIKQVNTEDKTAVFQMKNSWEYKINQLQDKSDVGRFIPGHFAGNLAGLFNSAIDFEVVQSQLDGDEWDEFRFFPAKKSPVEDIREFLRTQEQQEMAQIESRVEERTKELTNLVREISSPIIPVLDHIVVMPLLGKYDELRANDMMTHTITELPGYSASYLILDVTGIDQNINDYTISLIQRLTSAAALLGTKCILVGISPTLGIKITQSGLDLNKIDCFSTLKHGIHFALAQEGKQIIG